MPELTVTDEQLRRLESVCEDLEAAYVGPYGSARPDDALEYLLDTYSPPEATAGGGEGSVDASSCDREVDDSDGGASDTTTGRDAIEALTAIDGVGEVTANALAEAGFDSLAAVASADPEALTAADGVGEKQAVDVAAAATEMDGPSENAGSDAADDRAQRAEPQSSNSPEDTLQQAMSLLDAHDDRWREGSGDEPYEVDLPDGSAQGVRTKDDVKRLLFEHWR